MKPSFHTIIHNDQRPEGSAELIAHLRKSAEQLGGPRGAAEFWLMAYDDNNRPVGVLEASIMFGWLFIANLFVEEEFRNQKIGQKLMEQVEEEAVKRGCHGIYLNTFSFQVPDFYLRLGYELFASLDDFPPGHQRHFFCKKLVTDLS